MDFNNKGQVRIAQAFLIAAAIATRDAAQSLASYLDDSSAGVERAVPILKTIKTAAEVAEIALTVAGGIGLVRGAMRAAAAAETAAADEVWVAGERFIKEFSAKNPSFAEAVNTPVRVVRMPPGTKGGGLRNLRGVGEGWHKW